MEDPAITTTEDGGIVRCEPNEKKKLAFQDFQLMRTGTTRESVTQSFFESVYMCFNDFRKLDPDERKVFITKERDRLAQIMMTYTCMACLLMTAWGVSKFEQGVRDVYYRLYVRYMTTNESDTNTSDTRKYHDLKALDVLLDDMNEVVNPDAIEIWMHILTPSVFESQVMKTLLSDTSRVYDDYASFQHTPDDQEDHDENDRHGVCSFFQKYFVSTLHTAMDTRLEKWTQKGLVDLTEDQHSQLMDILDQISAIVFDCVCEWIIMFYRSVVRGDLDEVDPFQHDTLEILTVLCPSISFDIMVMDMKTLEPVFDSLRVVQNSSETETPRSHNVVLLGQFTHDDQQSGFESIGIITPDSKLSRIFSADSECIQCLRDMFDKEETTTGQDT